MLMPSIFGENLFDDFFNDFPFYYDDKAMKDTEKKLYGKRASHVMKTDIKEMDNGYQLVVDLPGFTKDEIKASLENGLSDHQRRERSGQRRAGERIWSLHPQGALRRSLQQKLLCRRGCSAGGY